ncbi:major facilitator superfamily [Blastochloris viridis]|uniref:Major facilitator superfamily n=1 Tax=Blastochloris viridis TaxID=1079 RepID=A0A182D587_BLAVI|nr:major facilitator superfamily [Blastochloris viridis]
MFGTYPVSVLAALLVAGALSDHIGRRPVIFATLLFEGAAMALFVAAQAVPMLIVARFLQGLATGAAMSAVGAALIDAHRGHGPLVNSVAPLIGLALGALGAGALVAFAPLPLRLVYALLLAAIAVQAILVWFVPETAVGRPGALVSLKPTIAVPAQARRALLRVTPLNIAVWALGGLFLSLVPALIRAATGITSPMVGGSVVATLCLSGAAAVLWLRSRPTMEIAVLAIAALVLGVVGLMTSLHAGVVAGLFGGTLVAGIGFGGGFLACLRTLLPLVSPAERSGLLAALYVVSYLAHSLPAIAAGLLAREIGLVATTDLYAAALVALALAAAVTMRDAWRCEQAAARGAVGAAGNNVTIKGAGTPPATRNSP